MNVVIEAVKVGVSEKTRDGGTEGETQRQSRRERGEAARAGGWAGGGGGW